MEEPVISTSATASSTSQSPDLTRLLEQYQKEAEDYARELLEIRKSSQNSLLERIKTEQFSGNSSTGSVIHVKHDSVNDASINPASSKPSNKPSSTIENAVNDVDKEPSDRVFSVAPSTPKSLSKLSKSLKNVGGGLGSKANVNSSNTTIFQDDKTNVQVKQSMNNLAVTLDKSVQRSLETLTSTVEQALIRSSQTNLNDGVVTSSTRAVSRSSNNVGPGGNVNYEEEIITIKASPTRKSAQSLANGGAIEGVGSVKKTEINLTESHNHHHHHHNNISEGLPSITNISVQKQPSPAPAPVPQTPPVKYLYSEHVQTDPAPAAPEPAVDLSAITGMRLDFERQEKEYLASIKTLSDGNKELLGQMGQLQSGLLHRDNDIKALQDQIGILQNTMKMNFEAVHAKDQILQDTLNNNLLGPEANATAIEDFNDTPDDELFFSTLGTRRDSIHSATEQNDDFSAVIKMLTETMDLIANPLNSNSPTKHASGSRVADIGISVNNTIDNPRMKANENLIKAIEEETKVLVLQYRQLQDELHNSQEHHRRMQAQHAEDLYQAESELQKVLDRGRDNEKERSQYLGFLEEYGRQYTIFEPGAEAIHPLPFHKHWNDMKGRVETLHETLAKQSSQLSQRDRMIEEKDKAISELKKHGVQLERKVKKMDQEAAKVQTLVQEQHEEIQRLKRQIDGVNAEKEHLESAIVRINESYSVIFSN